MTSLKANSSSRILLSRETISGLKEGSKTSSTLLTHACTRQILTGVFSRGETPPQAC